MNHSQYSQYSQSSRDLDFAYKVRHALNETTESLPSTTTERLASARQLALSRKRSEAPAFTRAFHGVMAGNNGQPSSNAPGQNWIGKMGLALPVVILVLSLTGIYQHEREHHISDLAALDTEVLADELPPDAYLDTGFSAYLAKAED